MLGCNAKEVKKEKIMPDWNYEFDYEVYLPTDFDEFESVEIEFRESLVAAYPLGQFITLEDIEAEEDERDQYHYEIVAEDDYSPRITMPYDLTWEKIQEGYYIPEASRTYFSEKGEELPFNVKGANRIKLYRIPAEMEVDVEEEELPIAS